MDESVKNEVNTLALVEEALSLALPEAPASQVILRHGGDGPLDTRQALATNSRGELVAVVKVGRGSEARERLRCERDRLRHFRDVMHGDMPDATPTALALLERGEHTAIALSPLKGRRLKDIPPAATERREGLVDEVVSWLLLFAKTRGNARVELSDAFLQSAVGDLVEDYIRRFRTEAKEAIALRALASSLRETLGAGTLLVPSHGDFNDANIMVHVDGLGVVDWDEPAPAALPGSDLFQFLASLAATRDGIGSAAEFSASFASTFFGSSREAITSRDAWRTYADALDVPRDAGLPLFLLAWVRLALDKLDYLEASLGPAGATAPGSWPWDPQTHYPVTFFADGSCLNVRLAVREGKDFAS